MSMLNDPYSNKGASVVHTELLFLRWSRCDEIAPPPKRLLLLKTDRNQYHTGWLAYERKGKYYFWLDANSRQIARRADYWWQVPSELYPENNITENLSPDELQRQYSALQLRDQHNFVYNSPTFKQDRPQIIPPDVVHKASAGTKPNKTEEKVVIDPETGRPRIPEGYFADTHPNWFKKHYPEMFNLPDDDDND